MRWKNSSFFPLSLFQDSSGAQSEDEVEQLAEYSASLYAKTPEEKAHHLDYYRNFYRSGGDATAAREGLKQQRAAAEEKMKSASSKLPELGKVTVNGVEHKKYRKCPIGLLLPLRINRGLLFTAYVNFGFV